MTTAQIIALVEQFIAYDLDIYPSANGATFSSADIITAVNNSLQDLSEICKLREPMIALTLTASQNLYDTQAYTCCPREFVQVYDVIINGNMLLNAANNDYGPWSLVELERAYPNWRTDPGGDPFAFVWLGNSKILLYPTPTSATVAEGNHFLSGQVYAIPLDSTVPTGVPLLPGRVHEALCRHAAARLADPVATEPGQIARIKNFYAYAIAQCKTEGDRNDDAATAWGSVSGGRNKKYLQL